jgi:hypothetical protein
VAMRCGAIFVSTGALSFDMRFNVGDIVRYGYYMPTDPWFMNKATDKGIIIKRFFLAGMPTYLIRGINNNLLVTLREYNMEILSEV